MVTSFAIFTFGCSDSEKLASESAAAAALAKSDAAAQAAADATNAAYYAAEAAKKEAAGIAGFSEERICQAGIATMMARDPRTIITKTNDGITSLHYMREEDQTKWSWLCKLNGDRLIWATDTGRWRTHPQDEVLTYRVTGSSLSIVYAGADGSVLGKESFELSQLEK